MEEENSDQRELLNDEWLSRALRARSQIEVRPGLEERILARLAAGQDRNPQRRWRWMPALAVAFGLVLIVFLGRALLHVRPHTQDDQAKRVQPQNVRPEGAASKGRSVQASKAHTDSKKHFPRRADTGNSDSPVLVEANTLPKLDKFPVETPASEQEKLMAEIQRRQSAEALAQYARDFREGKDLAIENNSIPPLSTETADEKPNR